MPELSAAFWFVRACDQPRSGVLVMERGRAEQELSAQVLLTCSGGLVMERGRAEQELSAQGLLRCPRFAAEQGHGQILV